MLACFENFVNSPGPEMRSAFFCVIDKLTYSNHSFVCAQNILLPVSSVFMFACLGFSCMGFKEIK